MIANISDAKIDIDTETKLTKFRRQRIQMRFLVWKYMNFDQYFTEVCSQGSN